MLSAKSFNLDQSKILSSGKEYAMVLSKHRHFTLGRYYVITNKFLEKRCGGGVFITLNHYYTKLLKTMWEMEKFLVTSIFHFLLFPQCFLPFQKKNSILSHIYFVVCKFFQFGLV